MQEVRPAVRWSGALAIVLALHATVAWWLLNHGILPMMMPPALEVVMLDLAPDLPPVQPAAVELPAPATLPPPPTPPLPENPPETPLSPLPGVELPPTPPVEAEVVLPPPLRRPQPKPKPRPPERLVQPRPASVADETPRPIAPAPVQAAPAQASARPPAPVAPVTPTWRSELLARLQRAKRYPDQARSHGDQGVATVTFTMDRGGRVISVSLVRGSGSTLLDDEAVALVRRAEPLPVYPTRCRVAQSR